MTECILRNDVGRKNGESKIHPHGNGRYYKFCNHSKCNRKKCFL